MVLLVDVHQTTALNSKQLDAARSLIERAELADGRPPVSDQAMIAVTRGQRALALFSEESAERDPVAVGIVGDGELDLVVDPGHRGRGVGTAALAALGIGVGPVKAWSHGDNPAADALLARAGFSPVRSLFLMQLDPALLPEPGGPLAVAVPEGFGLRAFDPGREADAEEWVRVNGRAFATHPEQGRITVEDFATMRQEPWFDAEDLILLEGPDGLAGSTWVKTVRDPDSKPETELSVDGQLVTELYAIGVDPAHAGRGLGKALLDATLARMAQHSPAKVALYVDGDNERAVGLYEAAGFTVASRSRQWAR